MSNPVLDLHCDQPDPSMHPQTFGEACAFIDQLLRGTVQGSYIPYVIGETTPAVSDQDKLWFRLDAAGRPLGLFFYYNGSWRRQNTGLFNEVRMYAGNPSFFFDATGKGIVGSEWDGWALANGLNGTPNLTDRFIIAGHMDGTSGIGMFSAGWQTGITGVASKNGGHIETTLTIPQIPSEDAEKIVADKWAASGNARSNSGQLYGLHSEATADADTFTIVPEVTGNADPDPVPTLPPYIALGFAVYIGYDP
jgi:hypothetical protein